MQGHASEQGQHRPQGQHAMFPIHFYPSKEHRGPQQGGVQCQGSLLPVFVEKKFILLFYFLILFNRSFSPKPDFFKANVSFFHDNRVVGNEKKNGERAGARFRQLLVVTWEEG